MYPEICKIGPFTIYSYGLALVVAFGLSTTLLLRQAKKGKFNPEIIFNLAFLVFIAGIIGARIFYIVVNINFFLRRPWEIVMLQHGGLSWFGGLFLGIISGVLYLKKKKLAIYKVLDLFAPFLALAQAIGRIGCFLNGCCFGRESKFGLYFPVHKARLIPTQLYSFLLLISIFIFLRILQNRPHWEGRVFLFYLLLYSIQRFFIEFLRADNPIIFYGLTLFQIICIFLFFFSLSQIIRQKITKR